jgi:predicted nucleic-acid-binding protein
MRIVDANVILRYLLNDKYDLSLKAASIVEENAFIPTEVIAEVVYVLEKIYKVSRSEISGILLQMVSMPSIIVSEISIIRMAFDLYAGKRIDFVDALLAGYSTLPGVEVFTFDKKLKKIISSLAKNA